jgi:hypothetical protein
MVLRFWIGFKHLIHPLNPPPAWEMTHLKIIERLEIGTVPRWRGIKGVDKNLSRKN